MNSKLKSILFFLPKLVVFGLALFDFIYIHSHISSFGNGTTISFGPYTPWYEQSTGDLWMILIAAVCLLISKRGGYIMGIILSGCVVIEGLLLFNRRSIPLMEVWNFVQNNELNIFTQWEIQFFVALIIFITTVFYLIASEYAKAKFNSHKMNR